MTIYEHSSRNSEWESTLESDNLISFNKVEDDYVIKFPYIITITNTKYISFKFMPQYNIDYINIKIDIGGSTKYIYLPNTEFSKLISGYNYGFYMNAKEKQLAKVNFTFNYMENIPFEYINIVEISNPEKLLKKTIENVATKYHKINDKYVVSLEYNITSYKNNLISLDIFLKYDIVNLTLHKEIKGGVLECKSGSYYELNSVVGYPYYLYIEAIKNQRISVEGLCMESYNTRIINEIYFYEFLYRNSSSYHYYEKFTSLDKYFSYKVKNETTNYIALYFVQVNTLTPLHLGLTVKDEDNNDDGESEIDDSKPKSDENKDDDTKPKSENKTETDDTKPKSENKTDTDDKPKSENKTESDDTKPKSENKTDIDDTKLKNENKTEIEDIK